VDKEFLARKIALLEAKLKKKKEFSSKKKNIKLFNINLNNYNKYRWTTIKYKKEKKYID
jgi:hypothetical protein